MEPSPDATGDRRERRWRAAVAGIVAAGAALAAGQVPSAVAGEATGPVTAVGDEFVDRFAASLKDVAVALFGQNDKAALVVGIVVVSLLLGAALGLLALRSFGFAAAGFVAFSLVGLAAELADASGSAPRAVVATLAGVAAGVGVLALLLHQIGRGPDLAATLRSAGDVEDPRIRTPTDGRSWLSAPRSGPRRRSPAPAPGRCGAAPRSRPSAPRWCCPDPPARPRSAWTASTSPASAPTSRRPGTSTGSTPHW